MMWDLDLGLKLEPFIGKKVLEDIDKANIGFLKQTGGYVDNYDDFQIDVTMVDRAYNDGDIPEPDDEDDEEDEEYDESENWTVTHGLLIELDNDWCITDISVEDRIWGDDGLGDENPEYIYTEEEYFDTAVKFLEAITIDHDRQKIR